jgi:hypothetical protein
MLMHAAVERSSLAPDDVDEPAETIVVCPKCGWREFGLPLRRHQRPERG